MRIGIIGAGISGLVSAYLLSEDNDIVLFEKNDYIGGHTHTIDISIDGGRHAVDTGFIVFNEITYPNFLKLLRRFGVQYQQSRMTFSVKSERDGLEFGTHNLNTLFSQRRNLLNASFYRMIRDVFRFRREFRGLLEEERQDAALVPYLKNRGYSSRFIDHLIVPLGASLWSTDPKTIEDFPLATFVRFFANHGFLNIRNPFEWKVIKGGSARYVERLIESFREKIRLRAPVRAVTRYADHVSVKLDSGEEENFDHVVLAVHSDQALDMLSDPAPEEREILGAIPYRKNLTVLHTDTRILPTNRRIWSSWNYCIPKQKQERPVITYDMNLLQSLKAREEFCVTLNRLDGIAPDRVLGVYDYAHPVYTTAAPAAQKRHPEISGRNRTHYAGAYWGYGFHEDGVKGALAACAYFGKSL